MPKDTGAVLLEDAADKLLSNDGAVAVTPAATSRPYWLLPVLILFIICVIIGAEVWRLKAQVATNRTLNLSDEDLYYLTQGLPSELNAHVDAVKMDLLAKIDAKGASPEEDAHNAEVEPLPLKEAEAECSS